jgi:Uma2 family endonuclease
LIDGRLVRKLGGTLRHQKLEKRWTLALCDWHGDAGETLHEWDHELAAPGHAAAFLVPDIAYHTRAALDQLGRAGLETPTRAPEVAVEVLSEGEPERDLDWKIGVYLDSGTRVVFVVDPPRRTVVAHARDGVSRFGPGDTVAHSALPGFAYAIDVMFEGLYLDD